MPKFRRFRKTGADAVVAAPANARFGDDVVTRNGTLYTVDENKSLVEIAKAKGFVPLVDGQGKATGMSQGRWAERYMGSVEFPDGVANQKVDVIIEPTAKPSAGWVEINIVSRVNRQQAFGGLTKRIHFWINSANILAQKSDYTNMSQQTAENFAISDLDVSSGKLKCTIHHRTNTANPIEVFVKVFSCEVDIEMEAMALSAVYDDDPGELPVPMVQVPRVAIGIIHDAYIQKVVLLHNYRDSGNAPFGSCIGKFVFQRGPNAAASRLYVADISTQTAYQTNTYRANVLAFHDHGGFTVPAKFATCNYKGQIYLCLVIPYSNASYQIAYFEGSFETPVTHPHAMKLIAYYDTNAATVLDAEINNSLTVLEEIVDNNYDSGWIEAVLQGGVTPYNNDPDCKLKYRKIGKIVYVKGTLTVTNPTTNLIFANLPAGFRPGSLGSRFFAPTITVGHPSMFFWMHHNGNIYISGSTTGTMPTGTVSFHTDFSFVAEA